MQTKIISTEKAPAAIGPYSQAIAVGGFVFCSGCIPLNPVSMNIEALDIEGQTVQVIQNMEKVLEAAGSRLDKVVKTTVFMKNLGDFQRMNTVYERFFAQHKPARSTVEVSRLPRDVLVEIECIAILEKN